MSKYKETYVPSYRLISTQPLSGEPRDCFGYPIASLFIANFCIVSENGKVTPKGKLNELPVFLVSLIVKVTKLGSPQLESIEIKGDTKGKQFPIGISFRDLSDTKAVTPWQLYFLSKYRGELLELAVEKFVTTWQFKPIGNKPNWSMSFPQPDSQRLSEAQKMILRRLVGDRARQKLTPDFYEELSKRYLAYVQANLKPIDELRRDYPQADHRTIQRWATTARRKGLLPKTGQGKVSRLPENRKGKNATTKKAKSR